MNERQLLIIEILSHASTSITIDVLAKTVQKSKRTVLRDLSTIKMYLETHQVGMILANIEGPGYKLKIINMEKFNELLRKQINDEEVILYELIQNDYVTIDSLTQCLFVSKITASEKLNLIKNNYHKYLNIEVSHKGHFLNEDISKKCILLSNLIENNVKHYLNLFHISYDNYQRLENIIDDSLDIKEYFPNTTTMQITYLFIAATLFQRCNFESNDNEFSQYLEAARINTSKQVEYILSIVSQRCIEVNLTLTKDQIVRVLDLMKGQILVNLDEVDELATQLYDHLKRMLCSPRYLKMKEIYNITDIKALYPFSFDLSIKFISYLESLYGYVIPNPDFIGLYFAVCLEKIKKKRKKILLYSPKNAIAYLNKQLLCDVINNLEVEISDQIDEDMIKGVSLIIDSIGNLKLDNKEILVMKHILDDNEITRIEVIMDNISIHNNKKTIFPKAFSFEYHIQNNEPWQRVITNICLKLQENNVLTSEEVSLILEREKQGNALIVNNYSIPHCVSNKENFCVCIYIHLDKEITINDRIVNHVLITLMNPVMQKNMNIFKFLYNYLNDNANKLENISSYDEFIEYI